MCQKVVIIKNGKKIVEDRVEDLLDSFLQNSYKLIFIGELNKKIEQDFKKLDTTLKLLKKGNKVIMNFICSENNNKLIWDILNVAKQNSFKPIDIDCGRPDLSYVYTKVLQKEEENA